MRNNITLHQLGKDPLYKTWHSSKEHLFMYFYSNGGNIVSAQRIFPIKKGALVFISAETYHYTMPDNPGVYNRSKILISKDEFNKILSILCQNNKFKNFGDRAIVYAEIGEKYQAEIDDIFSEISNCTTADEKELCLFSCCMRLLIYLNKFTIEQTFSIKTPMVKAIDYINKNIAHDIDIDQICSAVNISKYYFCRQFKTHTGMTVMQYILDTRIILAKSELVKTNLTISQISEQCGFSSVSYFCRVFKQFELCSPLHYRKKYKQ